MGYWVKVYVPGTVTAPPFSFVMKKQFADDCTSASLTVNAAASLRGESSLLITMAPGTYRVTVNGEEQTCPQYENAVAVTIPDGRESMIRIELR
jgi:hypothetical protein